MAKLIIHSYDLSLKHTFRISYDARDFQPPVIVELQEGGFQGYGEVTSNKYYGFTIESITSALEKVREKV